MVSVQDHAIRLEVGFSYQWAIDAQRSAARQVQRFRSFIARCSAAVQARGQAAKRSAVRAHVSASTAIRQFPVKTRDRAAAGLLGISPDQVRRLRQFAINPPMAQAVPVKKTRRKAEAIALAVPADGLQVDPKQFRDALKQVGRAISNSRSLPILGHVLLESDGEVLRLTATDLEVGITTTIPAAVKQFAPVTVPCRVAIEAIATATDAITITADEYNNVTFSFGGAETEIIGLPAEEFPMMPEVETRESVPVRVDVLKRLTISAGIDESRAILTGILIDGKHICSTDTHRLTVCEHNTDMSAVLPHHVETDRKGKKKYKGVSPIIIPARTCGMLNMVFPESKEQDATMACSQSQAIFKCGDTVLISRLIEGQFPNYEKVIPDAQAATTEVTADPREVQDAIKKVIVIGRENSNRVVFHADAKKQQVTVRAESSSCGKTTATFGAEIVSVHDEFEFALSGRYVMDAMSVFDGGTVRFGMTGEVNQFRIEDPYDPSMVHVLMPMQIS